MNKKHLLLPALLLVVSSTIFAVPAKNGWVGGNVGYQFTSTKFEGKKVVGDDVDITHRQHDILLGAEGAYFFDEKQSLGVSGNIDFLFCCSSKAEIEGREIDLLDDMNMKEFGMEFAAYFTYQHYFSDALSVDAGIGPYYRFAYLNGNNDVEINFHKFGIGAKVAVSYHLMDNLAVRGGLRMDVDYLNLLGYSNPRNSDFFNVHTKGGFGITPFVGCIYTF